MSALPQTWLNERAVSKRTLTIQNETYPLNTPLPHDAQLECSLLGAIMQRAENQQGLAALREIQFIRYQDFYFYRHGVVFRAIERLAERGLEPDYTAVVAELRAVKTATGTALSDIGGESFMVELNNVYGTNVAEYGQLLAQNSLYRASVAVGALLMHLGNHQKVGLDQLTLQANQLVLEIQQRVMTIHGQHTHDFALLLPQHLAQVQADIAAGEDYETGIPSGFPNLDNTLLGWRKQKMYVVAGSTGMGKSAFLLSSALQAYRAGRKVLFISLELTLGEILDRLICNLASLDSHRFQTRKLLPAELDRLEHIVELLAGAAESGKFTLLCLNNPTLTALTAQVETLISQHSYEVVFMDYAGWNTISDGGKHRGNTVTHTGEIYNTLNTWKKTYNIPLVVGCQISRDHEKRRDKRPVLSDLADSSLIEKNADGVIFLYRPEKYEEAPETPGRAEAIVAKNRAGKSDRATGIAYIHAELHYNRFSHWDAELQAQFKRDLAGQTFEDL